MLIDLEPIKKFWNKSGVCEYVKYVNSFEMILKGKRKTEAKLRYYKKQNSLNPTDSELELIMKLDECKIKYEFQKYFFTSARSCIADFYIPKYRLVIEVDGGYHSSYRQIVRDAEKDMFYMDMGLRLIRIKNEDVSSFDFNGEFFKSVIRKPIILTDKIKRTPNIERIIFVEPPENKNIKEAFESYIKEINSEKHSGRKKNKKHVVKHM